MDIEITETHDGGDFILVEVQDETGVFHDLQLDGGLTSAFLLSHFGGNVEASTTGNEKPGDIRKDFWGNALIPDDPDAQANSLLERALFELPLTSGNLLKIQDAARADLVWMINQGIAASVESEARLIAPDFIEGVDIIGQSRTNTDFDAVWSFDRKRALEEA